MDSGYRGEIHSIISNVSGRTHTIQKGARADLGVPGSNEIKFLQNSGFSPVCGLGISGSLLDRIKRAASDDRITFWYSVPS